MNQQSFDDIIKKKVEQFSAPVPPDAWDNIMGKKKRRRFIFFWWIAGLLLAGTLFVTVYENTTALHQSSVINQHDSIHQPLINKSTSVDNIHQSLKSNNNQLLVISQHDSIHQPLINKSIRVDSMYQSLKNNNNNNPLVISQHTGIHQQGDITSNSFTSTTIDIHSISGHYPQTVIDCSIAHVSVDTTQIKIPAKKSIWTIDLSITPFIPVQKNEALLYLQRLKTSNSYNTVYTADKIETSEELSMAYSFAIKRKINRRVELGAGLQYARIREKVWLSGREMNTTFSVIQRLHNDNTGPYLANATYQTSTTGTRLINAYNTYSTFSIPLFIQYEVIKQRRFSLYLNTGTYINVIRKYSNNINGDFNVIYASGMQQGRHMTQMGVDIFAGLRLATSPEKKYRFFAEPAFRYSFMKNNTSSMINAKYLHQVGLSVGVSYSIK